VFGGKSITHKRDAEVHRGECPVLVVKPAERVPRVAAVHDQIPMNPTTRSPNARPDTGMLTVAAFADKPSEAAIESQSSSMPYLFWSVCDKGHNGSDQSGVSGRRVMATPPSLSARSSRRTLLRCLRERASRCSVQRLPGVAAERVVRPGDLAITAILGHIPKQCVPPPHKRQTTDRSSLR